jgi:DNA invertase Pin-like site-specific DNA recombinase
MFVKPEPSHFQPTKRCALYARSATDSPDGKSIADQLGRLRDRAGHLGWTVVGEYTDRAVSGLSPKREGFARLAQDAKNGKFDVILTRDLDRISRNVADIYFFCRMMRKANLDIFTLEPDGLVDLQPRVDLSSDPFFGRRA